LHLHPERHCRRQHAPPRRGERQPAAAAVRRVHRHRYQLAPFQRLQIGGERGAVHHQEIRDPPHRWRHRLVERHHQRELPVGDAGGPQRLVEATGQRPCCPLRVQAETGVADPKRDVERQNVAL